MTKLTIWLHSLVNLGTTELHDNDPQKRVVRGVNLIALSIVGVDILIGPFAYFISTNPSILAGILVKPIPLVFAFLLNHRGRYTAASLVVYGVISVATLYYGCLFGRSVNAVLMIPYLMAIS